MFYLSIFFCSVWVCLFVLLGVIAFSWFLSFFALVCMLVHFSVFASCAVTPEFLVRSSSVVFASCSAVPPSARLPSLLIVCSALIEHT